MVNTRPPYSIPMMGTGVRTGAALRPGLPPTGGVVAPRTGGPQRPSPAPQPPELPAGNDVLRPPKMMGRAWGMRMSLPLPAQLAPGQSMTLPNTDPQGLRSEAPNPVGRPSRLRLPGI